MTVDIAALRAANRQAQAELRADMNHRMMNGLWPSPVKPQPKPPEPEPVKHLTAAQRATKDWDDRLKKAIANVYERFLAFTDKNNAAIEAEFEDVGKILKQHRDQIDELRAEITALREEKKRGWFR